MATESKRIIVSDLDFDDIKSSLKQYLRGQAEFSDYEFEGSTLSILLDILSYNTHYNALYNNMAINELFLDSATKRNSVVSRAKELGYIPHSATCSEAVISLTVSNPTTFPSSIVLPKHTPFTTNIGGNTYTFYTTEVHTALKSATGTYSFNNITIKEGKPLTYRYVVASGTRYIIPNSSVDLSTLSVRIQDSQNSSNFTTFVNSDTVLNVTSLDEVYFVNEIDNQLYEITFGDGVIGKELANGNIVHMEYIVTNRDAANGAKIFDYNGSSLSGGIVLVTTITDAFNGSDIENVDSIKYNAPKFYSSQNRAVTNDDYKTLIYNNFPEAKSVSVWGGQENYPPIYGKVFICVKPSSTDYLSDSQKEHLLTNIINPRKVVSVIPEFVDPEYIKIGLDITAYYDERQTNRTDSELKSLIESTVIAYNDNELEKFDGIFRYSKLSRLVDDTEPSIINNITRLRLYRELTPQYNTNGQYIINLINPIYNEGVPEDSVISTGFYTGTSTSIHYLRDDGVGNIQLYYKEFTGTQTIDRIVNPNIGVVNYEKGFIQIDGLQMNGIVGDTFELAIKPESNDVVSAYTQIASIDTTRLSVNVISDKTASGNSLSAQNYQFTSTAK